MDSTETARRLLGDDAASRPYAELTSGYADHAPIRTAPAAKRRAGDPPVPEHHDVRWASFAAFAVSERGSVPAVPFRVPVPLLPPPAAGAREELTAPADQRAPY